MDDLSIMNPGNTLTNLIDLTDARCIHTPTIKLVLEPMPAHENITEASTALSIESLLLIDQ